MSAELLYRLALPLVPNIGDIHARTLVEHFGNASSVFKAKLHELERIEGIGYIRAKSIRDFKDFSRAEQEIKFIEKHHVRPLFFTDNDYPKRLLNCYDAPPLLFYKGTADLNASKILAIVGTRSNSDYGRYLTEKIISEIAGQQVLIVSGLALGIDSLAHRAAIRHHLPTVGVVGHGLDKTYPADNNALAREMIREGGGILTEFFSGTKPEKHHFPLRNRIVAGLSDATILVETNIRGGSMITAKLADAYNRDVFAVPGRTTDKYSSGCNHLIKHNKAILLTEGDDLLKLMGWKEKKKEVRKQRSLFTDLNHDEKQIMQLLAEKSLHIDEINLKSGMTSSAVAAAVLSLELQGLIRSLPGKMYQLL